MPFSIETNDLTRDFGKLRAVDHINLRVERGSFYGFLGPNGAGKSTTIKMLTGLLATTGGSATLLGMDLERDSLAIKRVIGVVPEDLCLYENVTAREYLTFIGRMHLMDAKTIAARREELLALMELEDTDKTLVVEFSHGMKKKLSLAAALIHDPQILFLDEPFEGIDAIASRTVRQVLDQFVQRESTVFLTSHILDIVEKLCTHVGIIHEGRLVNQCSLDELAHGGSLEQAFIEAVGEPKDARASLSWLEGAK